MSSNTSCHTVEICVKHHFAKMFDCCAFAFAACMLAAVNMSANAAAKIAALEEEMAKMSNRHLEHKLERPAQQPVQMTLTGSDEAPAEQHQRQQKQARTDSRTSPLDNHEILDAVFSYVGTGDYFYTAAVCRGWRVRYLKLCYNKADKQSKVKPTASAAAAKKSKCTTSYRCAIMTAARLQLALKDAVTVTDLQADKLQFANDVVKHSVQIWSVSTAEAA
jgi:hypothetical protein